MAGGPTTRPNWLAAALATAWLVIIGGPILAMVSWSLQRRNDFLDRGPIAVPRQLTLDNVRSVLDNGFVGYLVNTAVVTVACIGLTLIVAVPAAYAVVRSNSRLAGASFRAFLLGLAIPAQATIIPVYLIINRLRLYDSLTAIILPTVAFGLPLVILILAGALRDVSRELYEAMTVDGAGAFRMLWQLVIPMSRGAITTVSIFAGLQAWNGYLFPLILTQSDENRVVTLGLQRFREEYGINMPAMMMAVLLSAIPVFLLYLMARRWLIAGLAGVGGK